MHSVSRFRSFMLLCIPLVIMTAAGCQTIVRRVTIWFYPVVTFPARTVDVGGGRQVRVPEYDPEGNCFCVGARFVPINAENKNKLTTSYFVTWPEKIKRAMEDKGGGDL
jgi:hypothetical protein